MKAYIKSHIKNMPDKRTGALFLGVLLLPSIMFGVWLGIKSHWSMECLVHIIKTAHG